MRNIFNIIATQDQTMDVKCVNIAHFEIGSWSWCGRFETRISYAHVHLVAFENIWNSDSLALQALLIYFGNNHENPASEQVGMTGTRFVMANGLRKTELLQNVKFPFMNMYAHCNFRGFHNSKVTYCESLLTVFLLRRLTFSHQIVCKSRIF